MGFVKWIFVLLSTAEAFAFQSHPSIIGDGIGLDHIMIGLPGSSQAPDIFGKALGFSVLPGNTFPEESLQQAVIELPPAYVELLWLYRKPEGPPRVKTVRDAIEAGGGIAGINVNVSPVEAAADLMRRLGMKVSLPPSVTTRDASGKEQPGAWQFILPEAETEAQFPKGVPGGSGVGFLEYRNNASHRDPARFETFRTRIEHEVPDSRRVPGQLHANTARKLQSVLVSVPNVADAVRQSERLGFTAGEERYVRDLGEKGREVQCGLGTFVFFEAADPKSALGAYVKQKGLGPFGFSVSVENLKTAQRVVEQGTNRRFAIRKSPSHSSFMVPAAFAGGTFVEFVQEEALRGSRRTN
jgi:hypothetical protein